MDVNVTISLPDSLTEADSEQVERSVFEQVIAESYRTRKIGLVQVRQLLGFSSRFEAEDFIHRNKATGYTLDDLKKETETMKNLGLL